MKLAEPEFVAIPAEPVDEAVPPRRERTGLATARRWAADFVVVVLGVFVALVADRWQASSHERGLERAYLERIREEMAGDTARMRMLVERAGRKMEALRALEPMLARGSADADVGEAAPLLVTASASLEQDFITIAVDELRSTGNLLLIRSEAARRRIMGYAFVANRRFSRILEDGAAALDAIEEALR